MLLRCRKEEQVSMKDLVEVTVTVALEWMVSARQSPSYFFNEQRIGMKTCRIEALQRQGFEISSFWKKSF
jgi:hypothetical protein